MTRHEEPAIRPALRRLCTIVTTWPFVLGLVVLIVNDAWLKSAYPGLLSGKLSDFAGVAVVSFLRLAAWPGHPRLVFCGIVAAFAWWKSPLSQPLIEAVNQYLPLPIGRTVDYADLLAIVVIPFGVAVARRPAAFQVPGRSFRQVLLVPTVAATMLALMATSVLQTRQDYQIRQSKVGSELDRKSVAATVARLAQAHGLECEDCRDVSNHASYRGDGVRLEYFFPQATTISFKVEARTTGLLFGASGLEKADSLRADLKSRLAAEYEGLEYIERLSPK